jgi:hypothetical protein
MSIHIFFFGCPMFQHHQRKHVGGTPQKSELSTSFVEQPHQEINPGDDGDGNALASDAVMGNNVDVSVIAAPQILKHPTSLVEQPCQDINTGADGDGNASASDAVMNDNVKAYVIPASLLDFSSYAAGWPSTD